MEQSILPLEETEAKWDSGSFKQPNHRDHEGHDDQEGDDHEHALQWPDLLRIGLVAFACVASWLRLGHPFAHVDLIALLATAVGGYPIFRQALANLLARRMTMELSMTIALGAALAIGEFFTALVITLFVLIAEVLEGLTVGRGRRAIKDLLGLLPRHALVRRGGGTQEIPAADLQLGDVVLVKPGARVPVDGVVREGDGTMTVWVTADRRRFTQRPVKVGLLRDGYYQILAGLLAGELVATEGALFLSNALAIATR